MTAAGRTCGLHCRPGSGIGSRWNDSDRDRPQMTKPNDSQRTGSTPPRRFKNRMRRARADEAYAHVKRLILAGHFKPGGRLPIPRLCAELATSRQPIMTAMQQLAAEDLVEIVPQVGCLVATPDPVQVRDFYRYIAQFEALMAELAAERRTPAEIERLRRIAERIGAAIESHPRADEMRSEYRRINRSFHSQIHEMAHAPILLKQAGGLLDRGDFYMQALGSPEVLNVRIPRAQQAHMMIVEAIDRRDRALAKSLMETHVLDSPLYRP